MPAKPKSLLKPLAGGVKPPDNVPEPLKPPPQSRGGRPVSNVGKYLIKPTAAENTGFEMINAKPEILKQVHEKYLKAGQLPPALQPKYLRKPEALDTRRAKNISKGWTKPRSRQG